MPLPLLRALLKLGDVAGWLGHVSSARTTSLLQDRLHARSFLAVPVLHVSLAAFWILTGILTLMPQSFASATALVADAGLNAGFAKVLVATASIADIVLGGCRAG